MYQFTTVGIWIIGFGITGFGLERERERERDGGVGTSIIRNTTSASEDCVANIFMYGKIEDETGRMD